MAKKYREKHKLKSLIEGDYGYFEVKKKKTVKQQKSRFQNLTKKLSQNQNNLPHISVMLSDVMEEFEKVYHSHNKIALQFNNTENVIASEEAIENLSSGRFFIVVDATFGNGGYTSAFLQYAENVFVIALDRDPETIAKAKEISTTFGNRFIFINDCFDNISLYIKNEAVNFFVCDFGVSSMQLDQRERGFSFLHENELDMRMNPTQKLTAKTAINELDEESLRDIIFNYGGETYATKIASKIIALREKTPINTTTELANLVVECYGGFANKQKIHPATKTFQAIRIFVNAELEQIENLLPQTSNILAANGVFLAVSFHELEDGAVKQFMKKNTQKIKNNKYKQLVNIDEGDNLVQKLVIQPLFTSVKLVSKQEASNNPRARSARMRGFTKILH